MKKHTLAFIDVETTGLDIDKHEIIQLGVVLVSQNWLSGGKSSAPVFEILEEFELKIKPERIQDAEPVALRVNGYNPADWVFAYTLEEAMKMFSSKTADAIMVGHNVAFDFGFIEKAFKKTGLLNKMHYHKLDTISMAFAKLYRNEDVDRFSLQYLCDYFHIENKNAHTALSDARATFELYKKLLLS